MVKAYLTYKYSTTKDYILKVTIKKKEEKNDNSNYWNTYVENMKASLKELNIDSTEKQKPKPNGKDLDCVTLRAIEKFIKYAFRKYKSKELSIDILYSTLCIDYKSLLDELPIDDSISLKKLIEDRLDYICFIKNDIVYIK